MKTIEEIRRKNLATLRDQYGGNAGLARVIDRSESQISQLIRGVKHSTTGKRRELGSKVARWIEKKTGRPDGWLDKDHDEATETSPPEAYYQSAPSLVISRLEHDLLTSFRNLTPYQQSELTKFVKTIRDGNQILAAELAAKTSGGCPNEPEAA